MKAHSTPATGQDRIVALDLLRGFAVLGILFINIWAYALPFPAALNPNMAGWNTTPDKIVHGLVFMTVYSKTMPIFSMLFGAGILLFSIRAEQRGAKPARLLMRRQFWLLFFGLVHAYLLWVGDILVPYAVIGMIVYMFRNKRPRTLLIVAIVFMLIPKILIMGGGVFMERLEIEARKSETALAVGDTITSEQEKLLEQFQEQNKQWEPSPEQLAELIDTFRGDYLGILKHTAPENAAAHLFMYPVFMSWNIAAFMLLGMVLFKKGIFTGRKTAAYYQCMAWICYGFGVPMALFGLWTYYRMSGSFSDILRYGFTQTHISGPIVALGHIALLNLAIKRRWVPELLTRLAATGRMAFTNYLSQTLICVTIFYGYGLGFWGAWNRVALMGIVFCIWALQLWWSPWWLARYRFGPMEWVWRSLTYGRKQPLRRQSIG